MASRSQYFIYSRGLLYKNFISGLFCGSLFCVWIMGHDVITYMRKKFEKLVGDGRILWKKCNYHEVVCPAGYAIQDGGYQLFIMIKPSGSVLD